MLLQRRHHHQTPLILSLLGNSAEMFFLYLGLSFSTVLPVMNAACPALCSCFYHKISDGSKARSVLCSEPELTSIPTDFPSDVKKLRIEKTDITQVASEAFIFLRNLEFLWMSFNSLSVVHVDSFRGLSVLSELRLEGNFITSFPWGSLTDMPSLRLLDLHNNRISSIPSVAAAYIGNLTYLDLSSNSLTTLPPEVLLMWFSATPPQDPENKIILGLHDNPWQCDCRLFDLVQFQKTQSFTSTFIDIHLRCSEPESRSGVLFPDVDIQRCQVPQVHTAVAMVRSLVGDNVLLRCGTVGVPTPRLAWSRADGKVINGTGFFGSICVILYPLESRISRIKQNELNWSSSLDMSCRPDLLLIPASSSAVSMFSLTLTAMLLFKRFNSAAGFCVMGCSCAEDGRTLLCMETFLGSIPENLHGDFIKIRIEKSHLAEIPQQAFSTVQALECLWLNFNTITLMHTKSLEGLSNLTELRLQGNKLSSVPWTAFQETPQLRILDLKHNWLDVLPEFALRHLPSLTYFDLSFNQLTVISPNVFLNWPRYQLQKHSRRKESDANMLLALHENRWLCDCRLRGFVNLVESIGPPIILMSSYLSCSAPKSKAGKFFHEVNLRDCLKPESSTPDGNVTAEPGSNTSLKCFVKARPNAVVRWSYSLKAIRGFTISQSQVNEDTIVSVLIIPSVRSSDRGLYTCSGSNFLGNSSVGIRLNVLHSVAPLGMSAGFPLPSVNENVYIDIQIAKQTMYGITIEWFAATENPSETWFTVYFSGYDSPKKEALYVAPGINKYSVSDLEPATKYEVCVSLKKQSPRPEQCIVFMTGSNRNELEQRERLIHIIVIVCAMVLAVPVGMFACTTNTRINCLDCCTQVCSRNRERREAMDLHTNKRQRTFNSLQAASDERLYRDPGKDREWRRHSEDRGQMGNSAQLY